MGALHVFGLETSAASSALVNTARFGNGHGVLGRKSMELVLTHSWIGKGHRRWWGCSKMKPSRMATGYSHSE